MDRSINYSLDLPSNLTWYYDQSKELSTLISKKEEWYESNYAEFHRSWFTSVFNLKTANTFGCVVWAYILNVPTELVYVPTATRAPWGLGGGRENFNLANFSGSADSPSLQLDEARRLLRIRYYAQTISVTVPNINAALKDVFGDLGVCYVLTGVMQLNYRFEFPLSENFRQALTEYLPCGVGVSLEVTVVTP